jgi:serine/threonine protein kinase
MSVTYLQKSSNSNNHNSGKYLITCQEKITSENPTTKDWLEILKQLKPTNFKDKNRVLLGVLEKRKNVVIKISDSDQIFHEYYIGDVLKKHNVSGFIEYICQFQCQDEYKKYPDPTSTSLCVGPGDDMKVIVMPYYSHGNLKLYKWKPENFHVLKTSILHVILSLLQAYETAHVIHNDIHLQNILIAPTTKKSIIYTIEGQQIELPTHGLRTIIMDFENAFYIPDNYEQAWKFAWGDVKKVLTCLAVDIDGIDSPNMFQILGEIEKLLNRHTSPLRVFKAIEKMFKLLIIREKVKPTLIYDPFNIFRK